MLIQFTCRTMAENVRMCSPDCENKILSNCTSISYCCYICAWRLPMIYPPVCEQKTKSFLMLTLEDQPQKVLLVTHSGCRSKFSWGSAKSSVIQLDFSTLCLCSLIALWSAIGGNSFQNTCPADEGKS